MHITNTTAAVVTGGASGLGAATARALAAKGAKVAIFDLQRDKGEALAAEIGGIFCEVNVTSDDSVDAGFAKAREAHGQESVLVCCAGTGNAVKTASRSKEDGSIKHFPLQAFDWLIQINLVGTFRCVAKSAAGMLTLDPGEHNERGAIVMTASLFGRLCLQHRARVGVVRHVEQALRPADRMRTATGDLARQRHGGLVRVVRQPRDEAVVQRLRRIEFARGIDQLA
ncbi:hypothetical protein WR25_04922 [Diploscapter pachys]|uniref:SDR family NAD(P)-dependent oxidoreductase n=1 Tax=Diploscapter pachys TaxID=2018661 RepID=A0A2A2K7H9_9BILA|nr:hypothetical protein WR25_04922 [Diploscapter pachys]